MFENKKKISIVVPSLNGGGAEKVAVNLSNYFVSIGFNVDIVVFNGEGVYRKHLDDDVNVVDLKVSRVRYVFFKLRKYLKKSESDLFLSVIRGSNIMLAFSSFGLRMPKIIFREANTLHAIRKLPFFKRYIFKIAMAFAYARANKIIANSNDTRADLISEINVESSLVEVISNPVLPDNYEDLSEEFIDNEWLLDPDLQVILSVGRLHYQKNFEFLIEVFNSLYQERKNIRLLIVGEGQERKKLSGKLTLLGLDSVAKIISFKDNIYPYYKAASVFALTSRWEGFGNVIVEALSTGAPVVSINCLGGPKMILENGKYGHLITEGDLVAFKKAIINELDDFSCCERIDRIEYAKKYLVSNISKDYIKF